MILQSYNRGWLQFMDMVSKIWPQVRTVQEGKGWLEKHYSRKGFDSLGF